MSLNIDGSDISSVNGGSGPSPSDPIQDGKILTLENKTQNINSVSTDGTKTEFINKIVVPEIDQSVNKFYVYNNDPTGAQVNNKDNSIPKFDTDGKQIQHSNFFITDDNNWGSVLENNDVAGSANCFFGVNQVASGFSNVHIGKNITAGNNLNNNNILLGSFLKGGNGEYNISIGGNSGPLVGTSTGRQNICIGNASGNSINTGDGNIFIGVQGLSTIDSVQAIGIGQNAIVRRNEECVINSINIRPSVDNVCNLGTPSTDPLHVARFKNLYLSDNIECKEIRSTGFVQAPILSATNTITTDKISNQDPTPTLCIELTPTTGIIKLHKNVIPSTGNTLNIGSDTASERFNEIASQVLILNDKGRSNKYYNKNGVAGIDIGNSTTGAVNLTGNKYQGHNTSIVTLNGSGQIQQPSDNASVDANGNITCKNLELLNIASSGVIKAKEIQSNDVANTLSLLNRATIAGKGIIIDATTNGNVQLTGGSYVGTSDNMVRLNTNGTIEKTSVTIDGVGLNNISNCNQLSSSLVNSGTIINSGTIVSPNFVLSVFGGGPATAGTLDLNSGNVINSGDIVPITDNTEDIGTLALSYKDIHIKGDVFKNGVAIGGGGGSLAGISSVDNGANDIEISFTGSDYLQQGYLTTDVNGRIQVQPSIQLSNAEYSSIVQRWNLERADQSPLYNAVKIYLPNGVPPGTFDHTIHFCYILVEGNSGSEKYEVRFIGYLGSTAIQNIGINDSQVANCTEIYNLTSTAHPNQIQNPNQKQHIINHFRSDYEISTTFIVQSVTNIAVLTGDVGNWDHTKPFFANFEIFVTPNSSLQRGNFWLYGSQNGFVYANAASGHGPIPAGYTEIF
jgi:hypothetical protein